MPEAKPGVEREGIEKLQSATGSKNTLRGLFSATMPSGIHNLMLPARESTNDQGVKQYAKLVELTGRRTAGRDAVLAKCPISAWESSSLSRGLRGCVGSKPAVKRRPPKPKAPRGAGRPKRGAWILFFAYGQLHYTQKHPGCAKDIAAMADLAVCPEAGEAETGQGTPHNDGLPRRRHQP